MSNGNEQTIGTKISELPVASSVGNSDVFPVVQSGSTKQITFQNLATNLATKSEVNAKYTKPTLGIPKNDLASSVQTSLGKADTAESKGYITIGGTAYQVVTSTTDAGQSGKIVFVLEA